MVIYHILNISTNTEIQEPKYKYREPKYKGTKGTYSPPPPNEQHHKLEYVSVKAILKRASKDKVRKLVGQESFKLILAISPTVTIEILNPRQIGRLIELVFGTREGLGQVLDFSFSPLPSE